MLVGLVGRTKVAVMARSTHAGSGTEGAALKSKADRARNVQRGCVSGSIGSGTSVAVNESKESTSVEVVGISAYMPNCPAGRASRLSMAVICGGGSGVPSAHIVAVMVLPVATPRIQ